MIDDPRVVKRYKDAFGRDYVGIQWTVYARNDIPILLGIRADVMAYKDERYELGDWVVKRVSDGVVSWHTRDTMTVLFMEVRSVLS